MSVKRAIVGTAALFALAGCGVNATTAHTSSAPVKPAVEVAAAWVPPGMTAVGTSGAAMAWTPKADFDCKSYQTTCWGITIASEYGCPRGYYIQIAISKADGTIIDTANDITAGLPPNGRAQVVLSPPDDPPAGAKANLNRLDCLG